ncbi:MAG: T9SS type A sorting domain-containing protein [Flavobacteriales bacterium]|nr:T9SS type A sorting domain-containing protein [Flavobacteriales bacterium]
MKRTILFLLLALLSVQGVAVANTDNGIVTVGEQNSLPTWDAKIYPNPNNGVFSLMITGSSAAFEVFVFNILGEKVFEMEILGDHGAKIDLSRLEKGLYLIQIIDKNRSEVLTRRMNIE